MLIKIRPFFQKTNNLFSTAKQKNYYEILQVADSSKIEEIKANYLRLGMNYSSHPYDNVHIIFLYYS